MTKRKDNPNIEDTEKQYLQETQEYIKKLKDNLFKKILALQQNKKTGTNLIESSQKANTYSSERFLSITEEKISL